MKQNILIKTAIIIILFNSAAFKAFSQESDTTVTVSDKKAKDKRPVKDIFESGYLLNNQTAKIPTANTLEFIIQHRFGKLNSEEFDLLGIYAPSNIRIGLNYTFTDNLLLGIGTTKNNKLQDISLKYSLLKQSRSGSIPVSITYFGDLAIDLRKDIFPEKTNRLSYFNQIIIARKFSERISFEIAPSYSHFNIVDSLVKHGNLGLSVNGRIKIGDASAILIEYDQNLTKQDETVLKVKPNLSIGCEFSTGSHVFQIFAGTYESIINQQNMLYNANDFTKRDIVLGFNLTRLWNY